MSMRSTVKVGFTGVEDDLYRSDPLGPEALKLHFLRSRRLTAPSKGSHTPAPTPRVCFDPAPPAVKVDPCRGACDAATEYCFLDPRKLR